MKSFSSQNKIATAQKLAELFKRLRKTKRIVFTNGCFDILHAGHVQYLEDAKSRGDLLIVALNSDASVKKLKGPKRPINPLRDRMRVIAGLGSVDFVTSFSASTPLTLIKLLSPSILVKGGDWKPSEIVGSDFVLSHGGKVLSLPFLEGRSSTKIIERASS